MSIHRRKRRRPRCTVAQNGREKPQIDRAARTSQLAKRSRGVEFIDENGGGPGAPEEVNKGKRPQVGIAQQPFGETKPNSSMITWDALNNGGGLRARARWRPLQIGNGGGRSPATFSCAAVAPYLDCGTLEQGHFRRVKRAAVLLAFTAQSERSVGH